MRLIVTRYGQFNSVPMIFGGLCRVWWILSLTLLSSIFSAQAQETVCAKVKIEVMQELTLERQAFDAEMKINNTTDTGVIEEVGVEVKITDEAGTPVLITDDPNDLSAKFYVRLSSKENIDAVDGTGAVNPKTTSVINWLIIPTPGSAGTSALGKKYLVGATLRYKFAGEETVLNITPDVITVKPLPLLTLDYFLTEDVWADDPLTPAVEPAEPFTLGVRIKNNGHATAKNLKIDSAQPKIVENEQGLLINFLLTGSYVNDAPVQNTLLINFGEIAPGASKMGRWNMETTLAGKFTEFSAQFSHADELGGALTSILQATNAHFLIRDVRVDLLGRDHVRDFLARDNDAIRIYESDAPDTVVADLSHEATLEAGTAINEEASFTLTFPATSGFSYVRLPDPFNGAKALGKIMRSDAKELPPENVWLSKTRNEDTKNWEYWINLFDVNSTGHYESEFQAPPPVMQPPVLQYISDKVVNEGEQLSFLVEASSPDGRPVNLSATPLPAGATFTMQAIDPSSPRLYRAIFDWTPAQGSAGDYLITYSANDGVLEAIRSANIKVEVGAPPPGPSVPIIDAPLSATQVTNLRPTLSVHTSSNTQDPTTQLQFEVYADEAETQLVASATVSKAVGNGGDRVPTQWQVPNDLADNTQYWWRARAYDGSLYSSWVNGRFFVNTFNDPPDSFNLTSPAADSEVSSLTPTLSWTNSSDKDGDEISYFVLVYKNEALTELVAREHNLSSDPSGITSWNVKDPLTNHVTYYWFVAAKDAFGARTPAAPRSFFINTGNTAPTAPILLQPPLGGQSTTPDTVLSIKNSTDADGDLISYVFEIDTVNTFDSENKRSSGKVAQEHTNTRWMASQLKENQRYWWRVKAQDGLAESAWVVGDFLMNEHNDAPPVPTIKNPGNRAWVATQQPSFQVHPVIDPDGEDVRYQFEIYGDKALKTQVSSSISKKAGFIPPRPLADKTTYWWRVRALDPNDAASVWSNTSTLYVSTAPYQAPTISMINPAKPVTPSQVTTAEGVRKQVKLSWEGNDPNIEPTIALYWSTKNSDYVGNLIVDGLRQNAGAHRQSYIWDVTDLAPGTYYIYAVIYDAKGSSKAFAPGMVVIPNTKQTGSIVVTANKHWLTSEKGGSTTFDIRLGSAPTANVEVPLSTSDVHEGSVSPTSLTFTPKDWAIQKTVTVTGRNDCVPDGDKTYYVFSGKTISEDHNYIGLSGSPVKLLNVDDGDVATTNSPYYHICGLSVVDRRRESIFTWIYTLQAELTNTGNPVRGVRAQLQTPLPYGMQLVEGSLNFGAVSKGETAKTNDTVTIRSYYEVKPSYFMSGNGFHWKVRETP